MVNCNNFDCSQFPNSIAGNASEIQCAGDNCTPDECCTLVPPPIDLENTVDPGQPTIAFNLLKRSINSQVRAEIAKEESETAAVRGMQIQNQVLNASTLSCDDLITGESGLNFPTEERDQNTRTGAHRLRILNDIRVSFACSTLQSLEPFTNYVEGYNNMKSFSLEKFNLDNHCIYILIFLILIIIFKDEIMKFPIIKKYF